MTISYELHKAPEIPREEYEKAQALGMHVVTVFCEERGAQVGDPSGVYFTAMVAFLPRHGDRIKLSDGTTCEVERAVFELVNTPDTDSGDTCRRLDPTVLAYKIQN